MWLTPSATLIPAPGLQNHGAPAVESVELGECALSLGSHFASRFGHHFLDQRAGAVFVTNGDKFFRQGKLGFERVFRAGGCSGRFGMGWCRAIEVQRGPRSNSGMPSLEAGVGCAAGASTPSAPESELRQRLAGALGHGRPVTETSIVQAAVQDSGSVWPQMAAFPGWCLYRAARRAAQIHVHIAFPPSNAGSLAVGSRWGWLPESGLGAGKLGSSSEVEVQVQVHGSRGGQFGLPRLGHGAAKTGRAGERSAVGSQRLPEPPGWYSLLVGSMPMPISANTVPVRTIGASERIACVPRPRNSWYRGAWRRFPAAWWTARRDGLTRRASQDFFRLDVTAIGQVDVGFATGSTSSAASSWLAEYPWRSLRSFVGSIHALAAAGTKEGIGLQAAFEERGCPCRLALLALADAPRGKTASANSRPPPR